MAKLASVIFCFCFKFAFPSASANERYQYAILNTMHDGKVEITDAVMMTSSLKVTSCMMYCVSNDQCVSFFYNKISKQCVLHSKHFNFQTPGDAEPGWNYFLSRDDSGRCPPPYLYYRKLDFCYYIDQVLIKDYTVIRSLCDENGGRLAAIDSEEKYNYFRYIFDDRPYLRVALGGTRTGENEWLLDDGSQLTYFNWAPNRPQGQTALNGCLELKHYDEYYDGWCYYEQPAVFVCERR